MQTFIFLDVEPSWLCSKSVAYSVLYLGMTLALCLSGSPGRLHFMCALSIVSSCCFSHLCEAAQNFMKSCCPAQQQAYRLLKVSSSKESVCMTLLFMKKNPCFFHICLKEMGIFLNSIEILGVFPHVNEKQKIFPWYMLLFLPLIFLSVGEYYQT